MSFYVDAQEQRHKARLAEQRLLEHAERRPQRPARYETDDEEITTLPPVFRREGQFDGVRETSLDRREARFRDTHLYGPPPPPPTRADEVPRLLPPPRFLVPQHIANAGVTNDPRYAVRAQPSHAPVLQTPATVYTQEQPQGYQTNEPEPYQRVREEEEIEPTPRYRATPQGLVPNVVPAPLTPAPFEALPSDVRQMLLSHAGDQGYGPPPLSTTLTPSQKKRLRRKRAKEQRGAQPPRPAPYPLPQDTPAPPSANGHAAHPAPPPEPLLPTLRAECGAEVLVTLRRSGEPFVFRFLCPLKPWPHPGQPHMVRLPANAEQDGTEIFLGWWHPGE